MHGGVHDNFRACMHVFLAQRVHELAFVHVHVHVHGPSSQERADQRACAGTLTWQGGTHAGMHAGRQAGMLAGRHAGREARRQAGKDARRLAGM